MSVCIIVIDGGTTIQLLKLGMPAVLMFGKPFQTEDVFEMHRHLSILLIQNTFFNNYEKMSSEFWLELLKI